MRRAAPLRSPAAAALLLEALVPYPAALERRLGHPVVWIGRALEALERDWNRADHSPWRRRALGIAALALPAFAVGAVGWSVERRLGTAMGRAILCALALPGLAQRSLFEHVEAVRRPLAAGDLAAARTAVARIVGRDVADLDETGVAGAALESLAESFNDGVAAPAFWLALAGLPGLWVYKAVNTADSLIGHREPRYRDFGWAAARCDDLMNLVPARLAGGLIALAAGRGWRVMLRDAAKHASPNAGWPEAAMAGALQVRLGGPVRYDGVRAHRAWFGDGRAPTAADLGRGLQVYVRACPLLLLTLGAAELVADGRRR